MNYARVHCSIPKTLPFLKEKRYNTKNMQLYNSLTQTKQPFTSIIPKQVKMYVCGITPYDTTHLGHAFTYLIFDILQRYLTFKGYTVTYTQNVTDVDDDLLKRAKETKKDWEALGQFWTDKFLNDLHALNIIMPTYYVKATDSIDKIIEINQTLIEKNLAYEKEGNVYFRTKTNKEYGKLSRFDRKTMIKLSKERGADPSDPRKEDPLDFILWQKSKTDEPYWDSKWGKGRPGWHIECSAMVNEYLGEQIDIHGGGIDLIYPHHESEIAQSESFTGKIPYVNFWIHTGAVAYQGEKMSKSLGNLVMVSDLLKAYSPNAIRYLLLSHHYRQGWEYKEGDMEKAEKRVVAIKSALNKNLAKKYGEKSQIDNANHVMEFNSALQNDLDTPKALKIIDTMAGETSRTANFENQKTLREMCALLGITFS